MQNLKIKIKMTLRFNPSNIVNHRAITILSHQSPICIFAGIKGTVCSGLTATKMHTTCRQVFFFPLLVVKLYKSDSATDTRDFSFILSRRLVMKTEWWWCRQESNYLLKTRNQLNNNIRGMNTHRATSYQSIFRV